MKVAGHPEWTIVTLALLASGWSPVGVGD